MKEPDADRGDHDGGDRVAIAENGEEGAERRLDQDPVGDVADTAADPVSESGEKAGIVAEAGLGIGKHAGVEIGLALRQRLEHARQHVHAAAGDEPRDDRAHRPGGIRKGARQGENSRTHHAADHQQGECGQRQFL